MIQVERRSDEQTAMRRKTVLIQFGEKTSCGNVIDGCDDVIQRSRKMKIPLLRYECDVIVVGGTGILSRDSTPSQHVFTMTDATLAPSNKLQLLCK
jgi:molybdopterin biosynthesis enzyme MoaB